ncbi:MAG: M1 family peptidase [Flavobacteriales bacterium]|nr:M1 family peptidase [Flavobacteriales bacterium]MCB9205055.1 M1 family peptidase [Flavobacteriales bacterium]
MKTVSTNNWLVPALAIIISITSCKTQEKATVSEEVAPVEAAAEEETPAVETREYQAAYTRTFDLIHTSLDVRFDWEKQQLIGKAQLTLTPYFYDTDQLTLDAKGFELRSVSLKNQESLKPLKYDYDGQKMNIALDRVYTRKDTLKVWVDYVAKPEELDAEGSAAIMDAKGLYFINPLGEDKNKPKQIWTQGETESSSCWFPTIDAPNENMTQDIKITVDSRYVTLSNGLLVSSKPNGDGTRTDLWKQSLPHAPYLAMMAIGEFAVVKDKWKGIDVDYYVEPEYEPHAKAIFGETPAMLDFYSDVLKYPYAWEKYSQVVVRDYVSGAMENTTATIHGEFLHRTDRELLDGDNERIIAHELFHHWFGDLVTCESWSNLPLNESFATYGEYLWLEHRHGIDEADKHGDEQMRQYFASVAQTGHLNMVRFYYDNKEDMFDAHSYNKGGRILHMLRKTIGDEAFFEGLNLYLNENKFQAVEMHQLRLAMEEVTGMDLNWFFNQWFFNKGHADLSVSHTYDAATKKYAITISQNQDLKEMPLYRIPMDVDIYFGGAVNRHRIDLTEVEQTFEFDVLGQPQLVLVDAENILLGTKNETLTEDEYVFMLKNAPRYLDKVEAMNGLKGSSSDDAVTAMLNLLDDEYWGTRRKALQALKSKSVADTSLLKNKLMWLAQKDPKSSVRAEAISFLAERFSKGESTRTIIEGAMKDRSYNVLGATLKAISEYDTDRALSLAKEAEADASGSLISAIASLYSKKGGSEHLDFFLNSISKVSDPNDKYVFVQIFGKYLIGQDFSAQLKGLPTLKDLALNEGAWWMRLSAIQVLNGLRQNAEPIDVEEAKTLVNEINLVMDEVRAKETNQMIKGMIGE